jgi:hypothetical protein
MMANSRVRSTTLVPMADANPAAPTVPTPATITPSSAMST